MHKKHFTQSKTISISKSLTSRFPINWHQCCKNTYVNCSVIVYTINKIFTSHYHDKIDRKQHIYEIKCHFKCNIRSVHWIYWPKAYDDTHKIHSLYYHSIRSPIHSEWTQRVFCCCCSFYGLVGRSILTIRWTVCACFVFDVIESDIGVFH